MDALEGDQPRELTRAEVRERLGLTGRALRRLFIAYGPTLGFTPGQTTFTEQDVERLRQAMVLEERGLLPAQVQEFLEAGGKVEVMDAGALLQRLEELTREVKLQELRRAEDRDRLLTALMRTQQEISHLRYELVTYRSRKDRRRGLLHRLLGMG